MDTNTYKILILLQHNNSQYRPIGHRPDLSFYEAQTLCDPWWQSQPTIDHNLYIKYLETRRLTLTRNAILYSQLNLIQHEMTLTLFM